MVMFLVGFCLASVIIMLLCLLIAIVCDLCDWFNAEFMDYLWFLLKATSVTAVISGILLIFAGLILMTTI